MIAAIATVVLAASIALKPEASVRGTETTLGEIAVVSGATPEETARLEAVQLGGAPAPGWTRRFERSQVEAAVKAALPGVQVQLAGADACRVAPLVRTVEAAEIAARAEEALRARFAGIDCELRASAEARPVVVPEPDDAASFALKVVVDERAPQGGAWTVAVQVWLDGALYRTSFATFEATLYAQQSVLVKPVRRGEAVPADAFAWRRAKVVAAGAPRSLAGEQAVGAVALRDLAPGTTLTAADVQRERLVRRGELVTVEVRKGAVCARSTMVVQDDGSLGDRVKVLSNDKKKALVASVTGRNTVRVDL